MAGQGDLSSSEFIEALKGRIEEAQRELDLAMKGLQPSLDRSPKRMLELLQRPTNDYKAAAQAENHRLHLGAAALALNHPIPTTPAQEIHAFHLAYGPDKKTSNTSNTSNTTTTTEIPAGQTPPAASKKRGRVSGSTSTDPADPPKVKRHKTAAAPMKGKRKP